MAKCAHDDKAPVYQYHQYQNTQHGGKMSLFLVREVIQDIAENCNDLRSKSVFNFIGNILVYFSNIFLNTIYKLLLISGTKMITKIVLVAVLEPFSVESIPGIFQDF